MYKTTKLILLVAIALSVLVVVNFHFIGLKRDISLELRECSTCMKEYLSNADDGQRTDKNVDETKCQPIPNR